MTHKPECPCNNADERGCFLISAETDRCVSCTCEEDPPPTYEEKMRARSYDVGYQMGILDTLDIINRSVHDECLDEDNPQCDWCAIVPDIGDLIRPLLKIGGKDEA